MDPMGPTQQLRWTWDLEPVGVCPSRVRPSHFCITPPVEMTAVGRVLLVICIVIIIIIMRLEKRSKPCVTIPEDFLMARYENTSDSPLQILGRYLLIKAMPLKPAALLFQLLTTPGLRWVGLKRSESQTCHSYSDPRSH
jgi:hypothetical protein